MATRYRPIDAGWIKDPYIRALVDEINRTLVDWSSQFNTNSVPSENITTGKIVTSIEANNTQKRSGALKFQNTATIDVASSGQNFTWTIDTSALIELITAVPAITYGTSPVEGVAETAIRTDATLPYPSALGVAASPITDMVTLTDDATEGALLTAANTFLVNSLALKAPNATDALRIGKYGNISMAGIALSDTSLMRIAKTDYNEAGTVLAGNFTITNTGAGSPGAITATITHTALNGASSSTLTGTSFALSAGNNTNNNFTGSLVGHRTASAVLTTQTAGTAIPLVAGFEYGSGASPLTATRVTITDNIGFRARMGATLIAATLTNATGFRCDAITAGTNRYGVDIAAITTGTPTLAYGVQVATHSVGTTRRAFIGGNTFLSTANDHACDTAAKGLITKDTQGTARYWRIYNEADGTASVGGALRLDKNGFLAIGRDTSPAGNLYQHIVDVGTSLPTT